MGGRGGARRQRLVVGSLALLAACAAAAAGAVALDRWVEGQRRAATPAGANVGPGSIPAPDPSHWRSARLAAGAPAPQFHLPEARTGRPVALADFRGRPVVLLMGSFGCNVFSGQLGRLGRLHEAYKGRAAFLFVAIQDAGHPEPVMRTLSEGADVVERRRYVLEGLDTYRVPFPALLDEGGAVASAYRAFPQRAVVVGADGLVVHDCGWGEQGGPSDWDLGELERHLRAALCDGRGQPAGR